MLAPLTSLVGEWGQTKTTKAKGTKKVPWHWDEVHQRAFNHVKATISKNVVLAYLDYSKVFEIYTDASSKQLGAVITQDNRPISFFSQKLSDMQCKYSVIKIELLAIVETLKEFKGMLWGQNIKVFTDHANLMRDALGLTSDWVYQWRLLLEESGPKFIYIKGIHNTIADAVLRLEYDPSVNWTAESFCMTNIRNSKSCQRQNWMTVSKNWCKLDIDTDKLDITLNTDKHDDWMCLHIIKKMLGTNLPDSPQFCPTNRFSITHLVRPVTPLLPPPLTSLVPGTILSPSTLTWADQVKIPIATK